jgi:putative transcriptional regulator
MMTSDNQSFRMVVKEVRKQLAISQEDLAHKLGISFATVNRWENGKSQPSRLARAQFDSFCAKMIRQGKLNLSGGDK